MSSCPYFTDITFRFGSTTNTTQILQARKQMEYDNNEQQETNNLIMITSRIKIIRNTLFYFNPDSTVQFFKNIRLTQ